MGTQGHPGSRSSTTIRWGRSASVFRRAVHPGEVLKGELAELDVTPTEFARQIDVPPNRISQIIAGKRSVTSDTALRFGHWFGVDPQFWLNLPDAVRPHGCRGVCGRRRPRAAYGGRTRVAASGLRLTLRSAAVPGAQRSGCRPSNIAWISGAAIRSKSSGTARPRRNPVRRGGPGEAPRTRNSPPRLSVRKRRALALAGAARTAFGRPDVRPSIFAFTCKRARQDSEPDPTSLPPGRSGGGAPVR